MNSICAHAGPPILCVIPYAQSDSPQTIELLEWIRDLGGCKRNPALLVSANNVWPTDKTTIERLAAECFSDVKTIAPERPLQNERWPRGANLLFRTAATWIEQFYPRPFWWNEPDCIPLAPGWLEYLEFEYYRIRKPFLGAIVHPTRNADPMVNGGCLYPTNSGSRFAAFNPDTEVPWDMWMSPRILTETHNSRLVHHFFGLMGLPPTFRMRHEKGEPTNVFTLEQVRPGAVVFHRNKDGTLINLMRTRLNLPKPEPERKTFYHSGDLGDVIYSLPTMRALGGGAMYLGPDNRSRQGTREAMTAARAAVLIPLLEAQPYVSEAAYRLTASGVTVNLNDFRLELLNGQMLDFRPGYNLARVPLHHWKLPLDLDMQPWLTVDPNPQVPVLIARSPRYHNPLFEWHRIMAKYRHQAAFVGLPQEHQQFCATYGPVPYLPTKDFLELARLIAGSKLFIGNQSSPFSVAIGLGVNAMLEVAPRVANCIFKRANVIYNCFPQTPLPDVC